MAGDLTAPAPSRDYAAEVVALGRAEPENPTLYNAIRWALDDWFASTSETMCCRLSQPNGYAPTYQPNHDDGDPWCDGAARYVTSRIRWAGQALPEGQYPRPKRTPGHGPIR